MTCIEIKNITKRYDGNPVNVLDGINLTINKGELVTLLGPSGCGKTTLLRCIAGLTDVTDGKVFINNKDVTTTSPKNRNIGMVFQQYSLFPNLTVAQNVAFGLKTQKMDKKIIEEKVGNMLETVQLSNKASRYPSQLSGGEQQRVALARAIVTEPDVLLLDEPLSAIDAMVRKKLQQEIRRIQRAYNITSVFVTHDQHEAMMLSDSIFLMNKGKIEQSGSAVDIYSAPKTHFAASFIGNYNIFSKDEFNKLIDQPIESNFIAIRPEIINVSLEKPQTRDHFMIKGEINDLIINGTILTYVFEKNNVSMDIDVLFDNSKILAVGTTVYISMNKKDCIYLDQ